jgi:hypothetical protein
VACSLGSNVWDLSKVYFEMWCWRRKISWTDRVKRKCYVEASKKGTFCIQEHEGRLTGFASSCVGTSFSNTRLKETQKRTEDEEEDVTSY